jgi:predicted RNA-binding Zn-ribbon protein involved in translation (DUF1610 family)
MTETTGPNLACPKCGEYRIAAETTPRTRWWAPLVRYFCRADGCGYEHIIEAP